MHNAIERLVVLVSERAIFNQADVEAAAQRGLRFEQVKDSTRAEEFVESPYVTAWLVDESVGESNAASLFSLLDADRSTVPFAYVSSRDVALSVFGTVLPDLVLPDDITVAEFEARLDPLLTTDAFADALMDAVRGCVAGCVADSFIPDGVVRAMNFRGGQRPVHGFNATIPMCGPAVSGRLSVSADPFTLAAVYRRMIPSSARPTERNLEDLVGEISNQLTGALKRTMASGGLDFALGVPMMFTGSVCPVRYRSRCGSVLFEIGAEDGTQAIVVDLALDAVRKPFEVAETDEDDDFAETGELAFL